MPDGTLVEKEKLNMWYTIDKEYNGYKTFESKDKKKTLLLPCDVVGNKIYNPIEAAYIAEQIGRDTLYPEHLETFNEFGVDLPNIDLTNESLWVQYAYNLFMMEPGFVKAMAVLGTLAGIALFFVLTAATGGVFSQVMSAWFLAVSMGVSSYYTFIKNLIHEEEWEGVSVRFFGSISDFLKVGVVGMLVTGAVTLILTAVIGFLAAHAIIPAAAAATVMSIFAMVKPFIPLIVTGIGIIGDLLKITKLSSYNTTLLMMPLMVCGKAAEYTARALQATWNCLLNIVKCCARPFRPSSPNQPQNDVGAEPGQGYAYMAHALDNGDPAAILAARNDVNPPNPQVHIAAQPFVPLQGNGRRLDGESVVASPAGSPIR